MEIEQYLKNYDMIYHLSLNTRGRKNDSQYSSEIQAVIFLSKESIIPRK